jgi:hypothetical protein
MMTRGNHSANRTEFRPLLRRSIPWKTCRAIEYSGVQNPAAPAQSRITLL